MTNAEQKVRQAGIDIRNTDPAYWETILKNHDLSVERVETEELPEVSSVDTEPRSNDHGDSGDRLGDESDSEDLSTESDLPTDFDATESDEFDQLRRLVDGNDEFMSGHQIVKVRKIERQIKDEWFNDWKNVVALILWKYPLANSVLRMASCTCSPLRAKRRPRCLYCKHKKDREAAGRMARVINLYFRLGFSNTRVEFELSRSGERVTAEAVDQMVFRIRKDWESFTTGVERKDKRRKGVTAVNTLQISGLPSTTDVATDIL